MSYRFTVKKTYHYYGYPEMEDHYEIDGEYFTAKVNYFGNHGFDAPQISCKRRCNGYFWSMHKFMEEFWKETLRPSFRNLKENEAVVITLED